jgi:hypothetical protein
MINAEVVVGLLGLTQALATKPLMSDLESTIYEKNLIFLDSYLTITNDRLSKEKDNDFSTSKGGG